MDSTWPEKSNANWIRSTTNSKLCKRIFFQIFTKLTAGSWNQLIYPPRECDLFWDRIKSWFSTNEHHLRSRPWPMLPTPLRETGCETFTPWYLKH